MLAAMPTASCAMRWSARTIWSGISSARLPTVARDRGLRSAAWSRRHGAARDVRRRMDTCHMWNRLQLSHGVGVRDLLGARIDLITKNQINNLRALRRRSIVRVPAGMALEIDWTGIVRGCPTGALSSMSPSSIPNDAGAFSPTRARSGMTRGCRGRGPRLGPRGGSARPFDDRASRRGLFHGEAGARPGDSGQAGAIRPSWRPTDRQEEIRR